MAYHGAYLRMFHQASILVELLLKSNTKLNKVNICKHHSVCVSLFFLAAVTCPEQDGYYPDNNNCFRFYQCGNGIPHIQNCPLGTMFNATAVPPICDHIRNFR